MDDFWQQHAAEWQRPGVRVVDSETGWAWRLLSAGFWAEDCLKPCALIAVQPENWIPARERAIAAGADTNDAGSSGILVAWLFRVAGDKFSVADYGPLGVRLGDVAWQKDFCNVESALRWALQSPNSPVKETP